MNTDPIGPAPSRGDILGRLQTERWHAVNNGETAQAAELAARIAQLSAATAPRAPGRETTAAARPVVEKTAAKKTAAKKAATTKRSPRVPAR